MGKTLVYIILLGILGFGVYLYLGRTTSSFVHSASGLASNFRYDFFYHAMGSELGRHDQWSFNI